MPNNFLEYLVIGLVILLFAKEYFLPFVAKWLGIGNSKNEIPKRMDVLEQHFNHEITDSLKRIEERLNDIHDGIIFLKVKINGQ